MAVVTLKLHSDDGEVYQVDTKVEVSIPAFLDGDIYSDCLGFSIETYDKDEAYTFTLTPKGMEELISFYNQNKNNFK